MRQYCKCINVPNQPIVHLKFVQCYKSVVSRKKDNLRSNKVSDCGIYIWTPYEWYFLGYGTISKVILYYIETLNYSSLNNLEGNKGDMLWKTLEKTQEVTPVAAGMVKHMKTLNKFVSVSV